MCERLRAKFIDFNTDNPSQLHNAIQARIIVIEEFECEYLEYISPKHNYMFNLPLIIHPGLIIIGSSSGICIRGSNLKFSRGRKVHYF